MSVPATATAGRRPRAVAGIDVDGRAAALVALALVLVVMVIAGWPVLTHAAVPGAVDHPYKFLQQQAVMAALSQGHDPFGWSPWFFGGYPELQFYPPGIALMGAAFAALPGVDAARGYWLVMVVAWFAPAVAGWATLRLARASAPVAGLGGLLVGLMSYGNSGTYAGIGVGVMASRVSLSCCLVAVGCFLRVTEPDRERHRRGWLVALAAAMTAATFLHLYFLPVTVLLLVVLAWRTRRQVPRVVTIQALLAAASGVLVAGFWWAGTFLFASLAVPANPNGLDPIADLVQPVQNHRGDLDWALSFIVGIVAWIVLRRRQDRRPFLLVGVVGPLLAYEAVVIVTDVVLDVKLLSSVRTLDAVMYWLLIVAALTLDASPALRRDPRRLIGAAAAVAVVWCALEIPVVLPTQLTVATADWSQPAQSVLWRALAGGEGRVIYTSNELAKSHLLGRTSLEAGRESVNGGPGNGSPMQAATLGGPGTKKIDHVGDLENNRVLLGFAWHDLDQDPGRLTDLAAELRRIGVTQIVAVADNDGAESLPAQVLRRRPDLFTEQFPGDGATSRIFSVLGSDPGRVTADRPDAGGVTVRSQSETDHSIDAVVDASRPAEVLVHVLASPYWTVTLDGQPATTTANEYREIVVAVPPGEHQLHAEAATPRSALVVRILCVLLGIAALATALVLERRHRRDAGPVNDRGGHPVRS